MNELIVNLGIDWKLFIAQLINFTILLIVLYRFVYKPVFDILNKRSNTIAQGIADADASKELLNQSKEKEKEIITNARKKAQKIVHDAQEQAQNNAEEITINAQNHAQEIVQKAQKYCEEEKKKIVQEARADVSVLVCQALEKILNEKMDIKKESELIDKVIKI